LNVHDLTHEGIKPFNCNKSDQNFSEKKTSKIQDKPHPNNELFNCTLSQFKDDKNYDLMIYTKEDHKFEK